MKWAHAIQTILLRQLNKNQLSLQLIFRFFVVVEEPFWFGYLSSGKRY